MTSQQDENKGNTKIFRKVFHHHSSGESREYQRRPTREGPLSPEYAGFARLYFRAMTALLVLQAFHVLFLALHDWVPLGRFSNVKAVREANPGGKVLLASVISTIPYAFALAASLYGFPTSSAGNLNGQRTTKRCLAEHTASCLNVMASSPIPCTSSCIHRPWRC